MHVSRRTSNPEGGHLLVKGTGEVNSTLDGLEAGKRDGGKLVITGNGESTVDGLQVGHADVGQLGVVLEDEVTSLGQVGGGEGLELGTPEAELTGELLKRRNRHRGDVLEGHVGTGAEVGKVNLEGVVVTREADEVGSVLQVVDVDSLQITVVLDAEGTDGLQLDTVQVGQTSVGDADIAGLGNTSVEVQGLELGESLPVDGADGGKLGEAEQGQGGETLEVEVVTDGGKGRSSDRADVGGTAGDDATGDLLDTAEGEITAVGLLDGKVTLESGARVDAVGIALVLNGGVTTAVIGESQLGSGQRGQEVLERHCRC